MYKEIKLIPVNGVFVRKVIVKTTTSNTTEKSDLFKKCWKTAGLWR